MIQSVADFIQAWVPAILYAERAGTEIPEDSLYESTTLTIFGSQSNLLYKPIHRFNRSRFNDDIRRISIELEYKDKDTDNDQWQRNAPQQDQDRNQDQDSKLWHRNAPPPNQVAVVIQLRFGHNLDDTDLSVAVNGPGAREKALQIEEGLLRILSRDRNNNGIAYPNEFIPTLIFVGGFLIGLGGLMWPNRIGKILCALLFGLSFYLVAHRFIRGYCSFETRRQQRLDFLLRWLSRRSSCLYSS